MSLTVVPFRAGGEWGAAVERLRSVQPGGGRGGGAGRRLGRGAALEAWRPRASPAPCLSAVAAPRRAARRARALPQAPRP